MIRFDLGGLGRGGERTTVNLAGDADVRADIVDYAAILNEGEVDEFYLSHTLEHVPGEQYVAFLHDMVRALKPGGTVRVIQTDAGIVIRDYVAGRLGFRSMRAVLFTPPDRLGGGSWEAASPLQAHRNMWSAAELAKDFRAVGLEAETFDPGTWSFDKSDPFYPEELRLDWGKPIGQLGVVGRKP